MYTIMTMIFLTVCSVTDLFRRQIWWPLSFIFTVAAVLAHLAMADGEILAAAGGVLLGMGLMLLSRITKEAIGYGDGLTVAACGAALGIKGVFVLLTLALFFSSIWSIFLLVIRKVKKEESFPFVPFLLAAQICLMVF